MAFVLEPENELILHGSDAAGARATLQCWLANTETNPAGGGAAAIASAVQDISNDWISSVEILRHATQDAAVTPTDGDYPRAADKAQFVFQGADGSPVVMQVPAPNETIFDTFRINVDRADAAVIAFVNYVIANCKTAEGAAITSLARAYRHRPTRRKHQ